jgi:hypothetical protein
MAIERLTPDPAPDIEDMSTSQDTTSVEEEQIVDVIEGIEESDIQMQEDGSAILGPEEEMQMTSEFGENLAEVVSCSGS